MLTFIIGILTVLSSIASEIDSISPKSRIILNTNYGSVMSEDEYNRMKQERQVRSIDITSDTIKVSIYGPSIRIPDLSEYKKCYTADIQINNKKIGLSQRRTAISHT